MSNNLRYWEEINGRTFADQRSVSMTETLPPEDYRWTTKDNTIHDETQELWKQMRLVWLDQFDLEVSSETEKGYRVWRWLGGAETNDRLGYVDRTGKRRKVVWSERRGWDEPLPKTSGLWPADR